MTATTRQSPPTSAATVQRNASLALIFATVLWGCGFTWAKQGGEAVQRAAGMPAGALFGPIFLLAWRFTIGGIIWMALFPAARRGWSWAGVARSLGVGVLLGLGLIVQHLGLDRTSEAVSALLTSLTILFVPLLMTFALRKPPRAVLWVGVFVATAGVWIMTAATPTGFGRGEVLGLACAFGFSLYILAVNAASVYDTPWRSTGGQFLVVGLVCFIACALVDGPRNLTPAAMSGILAHSDVWKNLLLMATFPTLGAFGLLTYYQPRIDPTRAAIIYLIEPVVATIYAAVAAKHIPGINVVVGAAMIIITNLGVELLSSTPVRAETPILLD